ncbi:MAG: hypothetical protein ACLRFJ_03260 [Alphaproteobacteria bacterium]
MTKRQIFWAALVENKYDKTDTYVLGLYKSKKMANMICSVWKDSYDTNKHKEELRYSTCRVEKRTFLGKEQEEK